MSSWGSDPFPPLRQLQQCVEVWKSGICLALPTGPKLLYICRIYMSIWLAGFPGCESARQSPDPGDLQLLTGAFRCSQGASVHQEL